MRISRLVVVVVVMNEPSHGPHATLRSRPFTSLSSPNDVDVFSRSSSPVTGEREGERERGREGERERERASSSLSLTSLWYRGQI